MNTRKLSSITMIRVLSTFLILLYHFIVTMQGLKLFSFREHGFNYLNAHYNIATLSVALFFIASGFGLYLSQKKKNPSPLKFYLHRWKIILVPYYLAMITAVVLYWWNRVLSQHLKPVPWTRIFYTLFGMDGYLVSNKITDTFYLSVGEWFLGALVIIYLIFPLLYWCMQKNPHITIAITGVFYITFSLYLVRDGGGTYTNVWIKCCDFLFGMYAAEMLPHIRKWMALPCIPVILVLVFTELPTPTPPWMEIELLAIAVFIFFLAMEEYLSRPKWLNKVCTDLSGISYEIFLIHHAILNVYITRTLGTIVPNSGRDMILFFLVYIILVLAVARALFFVKTVLYKVPILIRDKRITQK